MKGRKGMRENCPKMHLFMLQIMGMIVLGCGDGMFQAPDDSLRMLQADVSGEKYEHAAEVIENARFYAVKKDHPNLDYNAAIIDILSGNCGNGREKITKIIDAIEIEQKQADTGRESGEISENKRVFLAQLHHAYAVSLLCPTNLKYSPSDRDLEASLRHLYLASSLGIDERQTIDHVLRQWIPTCGSFIPEWQKKAVNSEHALYMKSSHNTELTVCPEGVWLVFEARVHEQLFVNFELMPLERTVWPDESSLLPFSQFSIEILEAPKAGEGFGKPVQSYQQPIPETVPKDDDYQKIRVKLDAFDVKKTGIHYLHLYTKNYGEVRFDGDFSRSTDCRYIDDRVTYSAELELQKFNLGVHERITDLVLCPERPDVFTFKLDAGQSAMVSFRLKEEVSDEHGFEIRLRTENGESIPEHALLQEKATQSERGYVRFKHRHDIEKSLGIVNHLLDHVIFQNTNETEMTYEVELQSHGETINYEISLAVSHPCSEKEKIRQINMNLENIATKGTVGVLPEWMCSGDIIEYHPVLSRETEVLNASVSSWVLGGEPLRQSDVYLEAYLKNEDDAQSYIVEKGRDREADWTPDEFISSHQLFKPITRNSIIQVRNERTGFSLINAELTDSDQDKDDSQKNQEDQKSSKENKKDKTDGNDTQNNSPDKPSESPSTPNGPGTDGAGDESTPDENAEGTNASAYDSQSTEKDLIDALLDDIEMGQFYVPLSGQAAEEEQGKDW